MLNIDLQLKNLEYIELLDIIEEQEKYLLILDIIIKLQVHQFQSLKIIL